GHTENKARKPGYGGYEYGFVQDHPYNGPRFGPQSLPYPDFLGPLLNNDQHDIAYPHYPGNNGTYTYKPKEKFDAPGQVLETLKVFQGIERIYGTWICWG